MKNQPLHPLHRSLLLALAVSMLAVVAFAGTGCSSAPQSTSQEAAPPTQPQSAAPEATATPPTAAATTGDVTELQTKDLVVGKGATAKAGDTVTVNYTGWLTDGTKFDSSLNPGRQPFSFPLGGGKVIEGWDKGVAGMKVGGKRELMIPPAMGYGAEGAGGGKIPPNATLKFEVELLSIGPSGQ